MTSDAKIGLLLGLVFIFLIAFIINGLPAFSEKTNNNELTTSMIGSDDTSLGIAERQRKIREVFSQPETFKKPELVAIENKPAENEIRFKTSLPSITAAVEKTKETIPVVQPAVSTSIAPKPQKIKQSVRPRVYVVRDGDNLALIAKKLYGPEEGNRRAIIERLFNANKNRLKSPDEIYVGQKLLVPSPLSSVSDSTKIENVAAEITRKIATEEKNNNLASNKQYIVREGDSLWEIASEQLGNGSRYSEITRLNADILPDEDCLAVGMRLKLPAR